ncbi:hypothetical protein BLA29_004734 [Euroglyphus maynei]|uniref:Uncharacterized protein n=1 Tax=Euroglyphus maynei TaxID=6958 RepID=A0A1Y3BG32_EURMA|nr:hypothetical protein BLA29_004734 [Euroglyphus maynei]
MSFSPELLYLPDVSSNDDTKHIVDDEEFVPEEKRKFFHSARDLDRYKRNYYLPKTKKSSEEKYSILSSLGGKSSSCSATSMNRNEDNNNEINGEKMPVNQINMDIIENDHHHHCYKNTSPEQLEFSEISVQINNDDERCLNEMKNSNDSIVNSDDNNTSVIKITTANDCNHHPHSNNVRSNHYEGIKTSPPPIRRNMVKSLTSMFSASTQHLPSSSTTKTVSSPSFSKQMSKSNSLSQIPQQRLPNINAKNYASNRSFDT